VQQEGIERISASRLQSTFRTNIFSMDIFSMFYRTRAALPHRKETDAIVNSPSATASGGSPHLIDKVPMNRAGQPDECAPSYVFLACNDSSDMTGKCCTPTVVKS